MSPESPENDPLELDGFSQSVRGVFTGLDFDEPTVWQIADLLLKRHNDYGGSDLLPLSSRAGKTRPRAEWLVLVRGLFDADAVSRSSAEVIDGRLLLLAFTRLDEEFDRLLRTSGLRWRLEQDLGFPLRAVLLPWALPPAATEFLELGIVRHRGAVRDCAFSPDGRLLATASDDMTAQLWDVAAGEEQPRTLSGHAGRVRRCAFNPDGTLLVTASDDGTARLWDVASGSGRELASTGRRGSGVRHAAFSPDGSLLAFAREDGSVVLWDLAPGAERRTLAGGDLGVRSCVFSPDGRLLATASDDGNARLWHVSSGDEPMTLAGHERRVWHCVFSPDGRLLATAGEDGTAGLWDVALGSEHARLVGHEGGIRSCAFNGDGRLLATAGEDRTARLWDVASGTGRATLVGHRAGVRRCMFSHDGRLLATASDDGTARLWDVASGAERATLEGHEGRLRHCAFGPDGRLLATASDDGTARVWEEVEPPSQLPAVVPDAVGGVDRLGIGGDAAALANVIAASETTPPLSIGLFGDWGSGKSFLIGEVMDRIRRITRRAQRSESSAYCAYVRNIEFNAWNYADSNLWASLVTHIFDELAKPEASAGVTSAETAQEQVARLEEELAAQSAVREQLVRAQERLRRVEARRRLAWLTSSLGGVGDEEDKSLDEVRADMHSTRKAARLLVPGARAKLVLAVAALLLAGIVVAVAAALDAGAVYRALLGLGAAVATAVGWIEVGRRYAIKLLDRAGAAARVVDVNSTTIDAEVEAARAAERRTANELADLRSGRRLTRFVAEREASGEYREHLGLISRIHDDFERMSELLTSQQAAAVGGGNSGTAGDGGARLPNVERIVLYIDDLDRCPPKRVVEVLEAVHLILAVPLFVVVIAVDPRWLLQSLRLHYSELLAAAAARPDAGSAPNGAPQHETDEADWQPTPINYLEKIIQVPFALRPMGPAGVRSLVHGLLPVAVAAEPGGAAAAGAAGQGSSQQSDAGTSSDEVAHGPDTAPRTAPPVLRAPSLSPRTLALTEAERDFAAVVANVLRTPRTVKKFTNLYRLMRAGLDEHSGQLDRYLSDETGDAPEYRAVLILLGMVIAFPEEASDVLLDIGTLDPDAPADRRPWSDFVEEVRERGEQYTEVARFLEDATDAEPGGAGWTREPFRRWALEVSRYSFATGQKVFSNVVAAAPPR